MNPGEQLCEFLRSCDLVRTLFNASECVPLYTLIGMTDRLMLESPHSV